AGRRRRVQEGVVDHPGELGTFHRGILPARPPAPTRRLPRSDLDVVCTSPEPALATAFDGVHTCSTSAVRIMVGC
ncbi:MAG TPA: hypothetical protein VNQ33_01125, partial [Acidimicrobiales bacterium]|nr:hypothetical protein [Acidimicrobiales bacterium]